LELILSEVPLDLFIEVPPVIGFTTKGDVKAGLTLGIGLRYILK
jgi:hypothetical protein